MTLATVSFQGGSQRESVVLTPPPEECIPTWREPPLLGRSNVDEETEEQAEERGHGCRSKAAALTKVNKSLPSFRLLLLHQRSDSSVCCVQPGGSNPAMFPSPTRNPRRTQWTTSPPRPLPPNSCSQWRACTSWLTGLTVIHHAAEVPYHPITGGQMERGGRGGVSGFSASLEL